MMCYGDARIWLCYFFSAYNTYLGNVDISLIYELDLSQQLPSSLSHPKLYTCLLFPSVMAAPKRAVVLRLAELERYPTTRARYEATLPFEVGGFNFQDSRCDCPHPRPDGRRNYNCQGTCDASISFAKLMEKAIRQTEKRWVVSIAPPSIQEYFLARWT